MHSWIVWDTPPHDWAVGLALLLAAIVATRHYVLSRTGGPAIVRALAVGLLILTALRPVLRFVEPPTVARPVRILLDDSLSMAGVDTNRSAGDWLRIAEGLGQYSGVSRPMAEFERLRNAVGELDRANQALAAARQADPIAASERDRVAAMRGTAVSAARTLEATAQRVGCSVATTDGLHQVEQILADSTETTGVTQILASVSADLRQHAQADDDRVAATDATAAEVVKRTSSSTRFELATAAIRRLRSMLPAGVSVTDLNGRVAALSPTAAPSATASPLTAALRDACGRAAADNEEAVVLVSDGRSTETRSLLATAASANVPVFTVAVAPEDRSPDARVTRMDARPVVLAGQSVTVRVRISQRNAAGRTVRVVLTDGAQEIARPVTLGSDNTFDFTWPSTAPPVLHLTARVDPLEGETRLQNNSITTEVTVLDQREHVLLLSGAGGRDTAELANALSATPWIDLVRHRLTEEKVEPLTDAEFETADVIILADVPPAAIADQSWNAMTRAVRNGGKSLLVLAGQGDWLTDAQNARRLAPLLPTVAGPRPEWVTATQQVWPVPTRFGSDANFLRLDESAEGSLRAWLGRPKLSRYLTVGPPSPTARPLLIDRNTQTPLLIEAAVGGGRSVLMLTDEVWRWSTAPDAADASRAFWLGLSQSLLDMPYTASANGLSLWVDRTDVQVGRGSLIRIKAADPMAGSVVLTVSRQGTAISTPPLRELLPGGGRYVAALNLPAGDYELTARQDNRSVTAPLRVLADDQVELTDTTPDVNLLKRMADATGGVALSIEELDRLPELLAQRRERDVRIASYELWCSPYWFAAIVACLGFEWAWRARVGLA